MAGSFSHCLGDDGKFRFDLIENMGDAHEACEEMFDMILWLADRLAKHELKPASDFIAMAEGAHVMRVNPEWDGAGSIKPSAVAGMLPGGLRKWVGRSDKEPGLRAIDYVIDPGDEIKRQIESLDASIAMRRVLTNIVDLVRR